MPASSDLLLSQLKTTAAVQADQLAKALGISPQAVRQQLDRLFEAGLVEYEDRPAGPGRPKRCWSLTDKGHARFPDSHAELVVGLIDAMRVELGETALDRLIVRREREMLATYNLALADRVSLAERVAALTELRRAEGYMARWHADEPGFVLIEDHCPIGAAAKACQGFCRSELTLFRTVLGPACSIERTDHIVAGARRCAYRITPAPART